MHSLLLIIQVIIGLICSLALVLSIPLFFSFRWPAASMWGIKVMVSALSPIFTLIGVLTAIVGWTTTASALIWIGIALAVLTIIHIRSITRPPNVMTDFDQGFGLDWENKIQFDRKKYSVSNRSTLLLPWIPNPTLKQDIPFASVPGSNRVLLCDMWQPPANVNPSGVGVIYLHGSAFYFLDKDCGTRPFFSQLVAQGHVIMDVAYRLAPETDIRGMVQDVNRAIVWMKERAGYYGIDADHIILAGGSAGAHLAMLAAYSNGDLLFMPADLAGKDTSVSGVISLYGTSDLEALYYHTNQHLVNQTINRKRKNPVPTKTWEWIKKLLGENYHRLGLDKSFENIGSLTLLLGGHPGEYPEKYAAFSPITYVHAGCPPTLLIHGKHDIMAPVSATYRLHKKLLEKNVPVVMHVLPQTDHAFDLAFPKISLAMHNALFDVECFLALMTSTNSTKNPLMKWNPSNNILRVETAT